MIGCPDDMEAVKKTTAIININISWMNISWITFFFFLRFAGTLILYCTYSLQTFYSSHSDEPEPGFIGHVN